jgi:hypothetical protein
MKTRVHKVIICLIIMGFVFAAFGFTLDRLQPVWTIRIGDGLYGLQQLKSFTFFHFDHSRINVTWLIDLAPSAMWLIAASAGLLSVWKKHISKQRPQNTV